MKSVSTGFKVTLIAVVLLGTAVASWILLSGGKRKPKGAPAAAASAKAPAVRSLAPVSKKIWSPAGTPVAPRERLTGAAWKERLDRTRASALAIPLATDQPSFALKVLEVYRGSPANRLGIQVDDRMVSFEGKPVLGLEAYSHLRADRPGSIRVWSPSGTSRDLQVEEGPIGFTVAEEWRPEAEFLRTSGQKAEWHDLARAAAVSCLVDEEAAETALYHLRASGYDGWFVPALMTVLAHSHGRHEEALAYAASALETTPAEIRGPVIAATLQSAFLLGQIELALKIEGAYPEHHRLPKGWDSETIRERRCNLPPASLESPSPLIRAMESAAPSAPLQGIDPNGEYLVAFINRGVPSPFEFIPPKGAISHVGPPLTDGAFSIEFTLEMPPRGSRPPASALRFSLVDIAHGVMEELAKVEIRPGTGLSIEVCGLPVVFLEGRSVRIESLAWIDLAIDGPWCEIRANGRCVALAPIVDQPGRQVVCVVEVWDFSGGFSRLERRDSGAPKLSTSPGPRPGPSSGLVPPAKPESPSLAWLHEAMVEGYLKHGSRSAAWDESSIKALSLALPIVKNRDDRVRAAELFDAARTAVEAGCDDPLVLWVYQLAYAPMRGGRDVQVTHRRLAALETGKGQGYSPVLRCLLLAEDIPGRPRGQAAPFPLPARKVAEDAFALLSQAAADEKAPAHLLAGAFQRIAAGLVGPGADGPAAFRKVYDAARGLRPENSAAETYRGHFFVDQAWLARGSGYANTVTEEGWRLFRERLATAAEAYEKAWKLDAHNPDAPAGMLTVVLGRDEARRDMALWIERAHAADPDEEQVDRNALWALMPRWLGSPEALLAYGRMTFDRARKQGLAPCVATMLLHAHNNLVYPDSLGGETRWAEDWRARSYWRRPEVATDVKEVFGWILERHPDSIYYRTEFAAYLAKGGLWTEAHHEFEKLGDRAAFGVFNNPVELRRSRALSKARRDWH